MTCPLVFLSLSVPLLFAEKKKPLGELDIFYFPMARLKYLLVKIEVKGITVILSYHGTTPHFAEKIHKNHLAAILLQQHQQQISIPGFWLGNLRLALFHHTQYFKASRRVSLGAL